MYDDDMNWHYSALHGGVVITRRLSLAVWQGVLIAVVAFLFLLQGYIKQVQEDKASLPSTEVRMQIEASVDSAFACAMAELDSGIYNTKRQGFYTFSLIRWEKSTEMLQSLLIRQVNSIVVL